MFMALIHLENSKGLAVKSTGKAALISFVEVKIKVDIAGGVVLGGMVVTEFTGVGMCVETLRVVAASRGFSGFGSGIISLEPN